MQNAVPHDGKAAVGATAARRVAPRRSVVDVLLGAFFVVLGLTAFVQARQLALYDRGIPGPGFFPAFLAVAIALLGAVLLFQGLRPRAPASAPAAAAPAAPAASEPVTDRRQALRRSVLVWASVVVGVVLMPMAGFVTAMVAMTALLLLGVERMRSRAALLTIVALPALTWLLFGVLLDVRLPTGPFLP